MASRCAGKLDLWIPEKEDDIRRACRIVYFQVWESGFVL